MVPVLLFWMVPGVVLWWRMHQRIRRPPPDLRDRSQNRTDGIDIGDIDLVTVTPGDEFTVQPCDGPTVGAGQVGDRRPDTGGRPGHDQVLAVIARVQLTNTPPLTPIVWPFT